MPPATVIIFCDDDNSKLGTWPYGKTTIILFFLFSWWHVKTQSLGTIGFFFPSSPPLQHCYLKKICAKHLTPLKKILQLLSTLNAQRYRKILRGCLDFQFPSPITQNMWVPWLNGLFGDVFSFCFYHSILWFLSNELWKLKTHFRCFQVIKIEL